CSLHHKTFFPLKVVNSFGQFVVRVNGSDRRHSMSASAIICSLTNSLRFSCRYSRLLPVRSTQCHCFSERMTGEERSLSSTPEAQRFRHGSSLHEHELLGKRLLNRAQCRPIDDRGRLSRDRTAEICSSVRTREHRGHSREQRGGHSLCLMSHRIQCELRLRSRFPCSGLHCVLHFRWHRGAVPHCPTRCIDPTR